MKKLLLIPLLLLATSCFAFVPTFPDPDEAQLIGTIGDSLIFDGPLAAGSIGSTSKALLQLDRKVFNVAEPGTPSFPYFDPVLGVQFIGLEAQYEQLKTQTTWMGVDYLRIVVVGSMMNDCSHTRKCTEADRTEYIGISVSVLKKVVADGYKAVAVVGPEWFSLHLKEALALYGITQVATEQEYNAWRDEYIASVCSIPGVVCSYGLEGMESSDGLHPNDDWYLKLAKDIIKLINKAKLWLL